MYDSFFTCYFQTGRAIIIVRYLPVVLCDVFLSISFPVRFAIACYHRKFFTSEEDLEERTETVEEIRSSYQGRHVRKLLRKPPLPSYVLGIFLNIHLGQLFKMQNCALLPTHLKNNNNNRRKTNTDKYFKINVGT